MFSYFIAHNRFANVIGIVVVLAIAYYFSHNRKKVRCSLIIKGLLIHISIALFMLWIPLGQRIMAKASYGVGKLYQCADAGISFVFGDLSRANDMWGFIFAFQILPIVVFFGALMALLFHWGIIQVVVSFVQRIIGRLLGTSGPETLSAIAISFLGQTESQLLVRHYLATMTRSELFVVMASGMSAISASLVVAYAKMGVPAEHMLTSLMMSIPASLVIAKIIVPETAQSADITVTQKIEKKTKNMFDAIAAGTSDGLWLALNVGAMLIAFLALLALGDYILSYGSYKFNMLLYTLGISWRVPLLNLKLIGAFLCAPFGWLLGFTHTEAQYASELLSMKIVLNELIAYKHLISLDISERTLNILTYALCGFSNISCIGIQIGAISSLVPEKRTTLTQLGLYALLSGVLTNLLSAMVVALLI